MSRVFMDFAASGEILFKARCGAKDFLDKLVPPLHGAAAFLLSFERVAGHLPAVSLQ